MISKGSCPHAIDVLFCRNRDGPGDAVRTSDDAPREHAEGAQVVRRCLSSTKPKKHERTKTANLGLRNLKIRVARRSARVAALKFKMPATKPAKLKRRQMEPVESSTERFQPRSSAVALELGVRQPARAEEADEDHHAHHEARLPGALVAEPAYERLHGLGDRLAGFSAHRAAASAPYAF